MSSFSESQEFRNPRIVGTAVVVSQSSGRWLVGRRLKDPFRDKFGFLGVYVRYSVDTVEDAAIRAVMEKSGIDIRSCQRELIDIRSSPQRDPRQHTIDVAFLFRHDLEPDAIKTSPDCVPIWASVVDLVPGDFAFDHGELLDAAKRRVAL